MCIFESYEFVFQEESIDEDRNEEESNIPGIKHSKTSRVRARQRSENPKFARTIIYGNTNFPVHLPHSYFQCLVVDTVCVCWLYSVGRNNFC